MSGGGRVVCVTGASGFIASWLVKLLLQRGYTVKATVRNLYDPKKVAHLKALEGADERLHLFQADLIEDGSFDSVVDGCEGVFHTASPVLFSTSDHSKVTSVRRVVVTSSIASVIFNDNPKYWYPLSKTLAEKAAWKFAEENGIDLVVMHPGFVLGPLLPPTLNWSSEAILDMIKGKEVFSSYRFADVRDVGYAHIMAFENPSASGRYCLVGNILSHQKTLQLLDKLYPSLNIPVINATDNPTYQVSKKKAESLGIKFMPLEVSFKDIVESLKRKTSSLYKTPVALCGQM
ncbi:UNVERIFIED_CONTAM: Tetraketide alpha-pyrone reductase 1 [Sesamum calycinum]|uniref:Tetraketide alpha-pyrone reductase 1 n=1 Tax=Sesamum calycinum TaxID=2727403 RepID=A0AAW2SYI8_9LAMI